MITHGNDKVDRFDWSLDFAEVFADGGFDVIVANPPYVRMELFKDIKPTLKKNFPEVHSDRADLYCYFYGRAFQLLKQRGMLTFISSNKWLKAKYGAKLRKHIADNYQTHSIIDFGDLPVFKSATAYPMIFIAENSKAKNKSLIYTKVKSLQPPYPDIKAILGEQGQKLLSNSLNASNWILTDSKSANIIQKMQARGIALEKYLKGKIYRGIVTGCNKAFSIDEATKKNLIENSPHSKQLIKPLVVGKNIRKYNIDFNNQYLLYMYHGIDITNLDAVVDYLKPYRQNLEKRANKQKWYELQQPQVQYSSSFAGSKIIYPEMTQQSRFTLDEEGLYPNNKAFIIPSNDQYLLGVLNSKFVWKYIETTCSPLRGATFELRNTHMSKIPIPNANDSEKETISQLVQKCLDAKGVDCEAWEKEMSGIESCELQSRSLRDRL